MIQLSKWLRQHKEMQNEAASERVMVAMARLPNVLETQGIAHQKTLEQKISEQGPKDQRVHPHLLGLAIKELSQERKLITKHHHQETNTDWYSNARAKLDTVHTQMNSLGPLYSFVSTGDFPNKVGDALELITEKCLVQLAANGSPHSYQGHFLTEQPHNKQGRIVKLEPPDNISGNRSQKLADFHLHGFRGGPICIECKNYREWIYPSNGLIKDLIRKSLDLKATPLLVARRLHYTTIANLFLPAGIIAHETYHQYYPSDAEELAAKVQHKRSLGFTDVTVSADPTARTTKFFANDLGIIAEQMAKRFATNRSALLDYANDQINLAQLYTAIGSPAGGKWQDGRYDEDIPF